MHHGGGGMRWKDIRLGRKVMVGHRRIVLFLLALVAFWALHGINGIVHEGSEVCGRQPAAGRTAAARGRSSELGPGSQQVCLRQPRRRTQGPAGSYAMRLRQVVLRRRAEAGGEMLPKLKPIFDSIEEPHRRLHESAAQYPRASRARERRRSSGLFTSSETLANLEKVQGLLREAVATAKENILSEDEMLANALKNADRRYHRSVLLAVIAGALFGFILTRSMTRPLRKSVEFTRAVAQRRPAGPPGHRAAGRGRPACRGAERHGQRAARR